MLHCSPILQRSQQVITNNELNYFCHNLDIICEPQIPNNNINSSQSLFEESMITFPILRYKMYGKHLSCLQICKMKNSVFEHM